ncbi:MAG: TGS domain-containing protein, partial [Candidatus ainarchaeum sp.]|nr:TGS domain-containing protein [Candidatus ainarchaeum sp.]
LNGKEDERFACAEEMRRVKPVLMAGNKWDIASGTRRLMDRYEGNVVRCAAAYELALRKAAKAGVIEYTPGASDFKILNASEEQRRALATIEAYMKVNGNTGVQQALEQVVNSTLGLVAVYPVEDEHKWSDRKGNVLPNVLLLPKGTTALQVAERVHTDLAKNFIAAVDARRKLRIGKDYIVNDGDVIRIISG